MQIGESLKNRKECINKWKKRMWLAKKWKNEWKTLNEWTNDEERTNEWIDHNSLKVWMVAQWLACSVC